MSYAFETKNLCIGFDTRYPILNEINLTLNKGDFACLLGSNGSGKSTFVRTISGIIPKCCGEFLLASDVKISMVPQFKKMQFQYPLTVKEVLLLSEKFTLFPKKDFTEEQNSLLEKMGIEPILNLLVRECSGGQLQKVLIARSLLSEANLIFLDEPLDALDSDSKNIVTEILKREIKEKNKTIFIITHHIEKNWLSEFNRKFTVDGLHIKELKK
ncbi:MAG TPA: ATP-binding cassette domain-containing protein [Leptospiraceae bacterium]|nr:ATP-binding cassette domain-containing protein [Leptospiraceae bacterium]